MSKSVTFYSYYQYPAEKEGQQPERLSTMAVCKCGEKLKQLYFQDGGGALECPGCGRYEERRVVTFKPILNVFKELIASETEEDKSMISDGEIKKSVLATFPNQFILVEVFQREFLLLRSKQLRI